MDQDDAMKEEQQITCRFVTKLPEEYQVPDAPIAVPSRLTRYGLSEIINHLLALGVWHLTTNTMRPELGVSWDVSVQISA